MSCSIQFFFLSLELFNFAKPLRGFAKNLFSKNPSSLWKWVGVSRSHPEFFFGKSSQNSSKPIPIIWSGIPCVLCLYYIQKMLLKVVRYYDLIVLSMSVMGFQKSFDGCELSPSLF